MGEALLTCCVAVTAWTVDISPFSMPYFSWMIFANGARQLVVHDAFETIVCPAYSASLTPITNIGASPDGAEITTFLAPPFMWSPAFSSEVKTPVDSTTKSAPAAPHGIAAGSFSADTATFWPSTEMPPSTTSTVPGNLPCVESYLSMYLRRRRGGQSGCRVASGIGCGGAAAHFM